MGATSVARAPDARHEHHLSLGWPGPAALPRDQRSQDLGSLHPKLRRYPEAQGCSYGPPLNEFLRLLQGGPDAVRFD